MRLPRLWWFAFWASLLQTDPSFAQAAGPDPDEATSAAKPDVVVLSNNETIAQRVRGHTVELDADIVVRAETPVGSWIQQAMLARAVAERTGTALVVWLSDFGAVSGEAAERRAFVAILLCEADHLYIRDLGPTSEAASLGSSVLGAWWRTAAQRKLTGGKQRRPRPAPFGPPSFEAGWPSNCNRAAGGTTASGG